MPDATLIISSRNYSSWSLRGWLLAKLSVLPFTVQQIAPNDPVAREELLLRSSSIRVPTLLHDGVTVWDTLAIAEYLNEVMPDAGMLPRDRAARARCRSIAGEMHSGFAALRASLPMNLRSRRTNFPVWSGVRSDIDHILSIWRDCLTTWRGPFLFGERYSVADAMFAPVVTRFITYDVALDADCAAFAGRIMEWPAMAEWIAAAAGEVEAVEELEVEF